MDVVAGVDGWCIYNNRFVVCLFVIDNHHPQTAARGGSRAINLSVNYIIELTVTHNTFIQS